MGRNVCKGLSKAALILSFVSTGFAFSVLAPSFTWFAQDTFSDLNIDGNVHGSYFESGSGSKEDPFEIARPIQLYYLSWLQEMGYFNEAEVNEETGNLELKRQYSFYLSKDIDMSVSTGEGSFTYSLPPIGTVKYPFVGSFDGKGHVISNLQITNARSTYTNDPYNPNKIEENRNDSRFISSLYKDLLAEYKKLNQNRVKEIISPLYKYYFKILFDSANTDREKITKIIHAMNESFDLYNTFHFELSYAYNDYNNRISKLIDEEFDKCFNKNVDVDGCLWLHEKVNSCKIRLNISDKILYKSKNELQKEFYKHNASKMDNTTYKNNILKTLNELRQSCILEKSFEKMESAFEIFETVIDPFVGNFTKLNILATYSANKLYVYQYLVVVGKICEVYGYGSPIFDLFNSKITDVYYKKAYLKIIEVSYYCSTILKIDSILPSDPIKEEDKKKVLILAKRFFNNNSVVRNAKNISNKYVVDVAFYLKLNFRTGVTLPPRQQEEYFRCAHIHSRLAQKLSYIFSSIIVVLFGIFGLFSLINQTFSTNIFTFGFYQQIPLVALPFVIGAALGLPFLGLSLLFVYQEGYNCGPTATSEKILNVIYCVLGGIGLLASIGIIINKLPAELTWLVKIIGALSLFEISSTIVYSPTKFVYTFNKHKILKIFAICISSLVVLLAILFSVIELVM